MTTNEPVDVKEVMAKFTTDVIGCCAFGLEFNALKDPESQFRKMGKRIFEPTAKAIVVGLLRLLCPPLVQLLKLSETPSTVQNFFFDLLRRTEEFRKNETNRRNDFMQLMLDIRDQELADHKENGETGREH